MSFTDPSQGVQPDPGQGAATGDAPYAEYLNRIPEEHRSLVEPVFKEWDGNVTKKFTEHSDYRKQWEPYEQAGLNQYDPQSLAGLIQFSQLSESPDRLTNADYKAWVEQEAQQFGIGAPEANEFDDELVDPSVQQLLDQRTAPLHQKMEQLEQWRQQQEQQAAQDQASQQIQQQLEALKGEHGEFDRDTVEKLTANYIDKDPRNAVALAFGDYQKLVAQIEQGFTQRKLGQPNPAQMGGGLPSGVERPKTFQDAERAMIEGLNAQRQM